MASRTEEAGGSDGRVKEKNPDRQSTRTTPMPFQCFNLATSSESSPTKINPLPFDANSNRKLAFDNPPFTVFDWDQLLIAMRRSCALTNELRGQQAFQNKDKAFSDSILKS